MGAVEMRHPKLPPEQTITVAAVAVPHHRAAGWTPVDEAESAPPAPAEPQEQPAVEGGESEPVAPKRRRAQKED